MSNVLRNRHERPKEVDFYTLSADDLVVGKDVLELVSSAMYIDPMTIYREYIQNAADAIDEARRTGVLRDGEAGRVDIEIDPESRTVRIRDNGAGITWPNFVRRLTALGASGKRSTNARGFRGVGRLAGLGYAQELIFRSRAIGESLISEMRWDCRRLKAEFRAATPDSGVQNLIRRVVNAGRTDGGAYPKHFFEVELQGMIRLPSDKLINPLAIAEYIGQVAPVPFSPKFRFAADLTEALRPVVDLGEIEIRISGIEEQIYRPHRDNLAIGDKHRFKFDNFEIIEIPGIDGAIAGIAWFLHHEYEGAIPSSSKIQGLRMRSGNIQVGAHALLEDLFPEPRFNVWSVGEVHVVDNRIVPNGRRDNFEQNTHYHNLINQLTPIARGIARRCRTSSVRRKFLREFELHHRAAVEKLKMLTQGSLGVRKRKTLALSTEQNLLMMEKIASKNLLVEDNPDQLRANVRALRKRLGRAMKDKGSSGSALARMPPQRRAMYEHLFELIYECATNRVAAKALIDRILLKIT